MALIPLLVRLWPPNVLPLRALKLTASPAASGSEESSDSSPSAHGTAPTPVSTPTAVFFVVFFFLADVSRLHDASYILFFATRTSNLSFRVDAETVL